MGFNSGFKGLMYGGIINSLTKLHLVGYCYLSFLYELYYNARIHEHQSMYVYL